MPAAAALLLPLARPSARLDVGIFRNVSPVKARARGHVQVVATETARSVRVEVELRTVERERRPTVEGWAVDDWAEWDRRRPWIERGGTRRRPDVLTANAAGAIGGDEDLQPVAPDGNAVVREPTIELRHVDAWTEGAVGLERARIDVDVAEPARSRTVEAQRRDARGVVLEDGRAVVGVRRVHDAPEILRQLPPEVVPRVLAPRDEQVCGAAAAPPATLEIHSVTVDGEVGDAVGPARVDVRPQVNRRAPGGVSAPSL